MKIDDSIDKTAGLAQAVKTQTRGAGKNAKAGADESVSSDTSDSVKLSSQYQALEGAVASSSSFDAAKVNQIKLAIANGQFTVDPEKVAAGLLDTARDLISARQSN